MISYMMVYHNVAPLLYKILLYVLHDILPFFAIVFVKYVNNNYTFYVTPEGSKE